MEKTLWCPAYIKVYFSALPLFLCLFLNLTATGGARDLFQLPPEKRVQQLLLRDFNAGRIFIAEEEYLASSSQHRVNIDDRPYLDSLLSLCDEYHDDKLKWYTKLFLLVQGKSFLDIKSVECQEILEKCPYREVIGLYWQFAGMAYVESGQRDKGFKLLFFANSIYEEVGIEKLYFAGEGVMFIGLYYYYSGYYAIALKYWEKALTLHFVDKTQPVALLDNMGLACMSESLKRYKDASRYFIKSNQLAQKYDPKYLSISAEHYGRSLQLRGKPKQALPYLIYGYKGRLSVDKPFAAISALHIAEAYLELNELAGASEYLRLYEQCVANAAKKEMVYYAKVKAYSFSLPYYKAKSKLEKKLGNFSKSNDYQKASLELADSLNKLSAYKFFDSSESLINAEKFSSDSVRIQQERGKEVEVRNLIIVLLLFLGLGITYLNRLRRAKLLKERELEDKKKIYAEQKIATSQETLELYVRMMNEKNELLEKISGELDQLRLKTGNFLKGEGEVHEQMDTLLSSIILSDGDWENFKVLFEQVYPGFLGNLKNKFKDLTASEIRLAALSKLEVPTKEMAYMLSVTKETIHTARYRLRKKLGSLDNDIDLKELIDSL